MSETPRIGDMLFVYSTVEPAYDHNGVRNLDIVPCQPCPSSAYYVGYTFKQHGKYHKGGFSNASSESIDYENPFLEIWDTLKVYRIRFHARGKEHYCRPEDALIITRVTHGY